MWVFGYDINMIRCYVPCRCAMKIFLSAILNFTKYALYMVYALESCPFFSIFPTHKPFFSIFPTHKPCKNMNSNYITKLRLLPTILCTGVSLYWLTFRHFSVENTQIGSVWRGNGRSGGKISKLLYFQYKTSYNPWNFEDWV